MQQMMVSSHIELEVPAEKRHLDAAREAAECLTSDRSSVKIVTAGRTGKTIVTTFLMQRARQIDIADRIMDAFSLDMDDYSDQFITFPKTPDEERRAQRKLERAKERRRQNRMLKGRCAVSCSKSFNAAEYGDKGKTVSLLK